MSRGALEPLVLEGRFDHFSLDELLDVVSMSRQQLRIEFQGDQGSRARLVVRSGILLDAHDGAGATGAEAFDRVCEGTWRAYRVLLDGAALDDPIGGLPDLLAARTRRRATPVVLGGRLTEAKLVELLDVICTSRPAMEISLFDAGAHRIGHLVVKAGELLAAEAGATRGLEAMRALLRIAEGRYRIERCTRLPGGPPLGPLAPLLDEFRAERRQGGGLILEGPLATASRSPDATPLDELFEVLGTSRQLLQITLHRGEEPLGQILLQSAQVLEVRAFGEGGTPEEQFRRILAEGPDRFFVHRRAPGRPLPVIGPLQAFLEEVRVEEAAEPALVELQPDPPEPDPRIDTLLGRLQVLLERQADTEARLDEICRDLAALRDRPPPRPVRSVGWVVTAALQLVTIAAAVTAAAVWVVLAR